MIKLEPFTEKDFKQLIEWVDSEELLVTIAGSYFSYPLTEEQLQAYLRDDKSHSFTIVDTGDNKMIGHAELCASGDNMYKIDKLLIGDRQSRGKGLCTKVMHALVQYAFAHLNAATVELNVFDWNNAAIRCYENTGFKINPGKTATFKVGDKEWMTLNMTYQLNLKPDYKLK